MNRILTVFILTLPFMINGQVNSLLDSSFNKIGYKLLDLGNDDEKANSCFLSAKNKIYVSGGSSTSSSDRAFITRLNDNGLVDSSFNSTGTIINSTFYSIYDSYEDANNNIIVTGAKSLLNQNMVIARILENGTYDKAFSGDGIQEINFNDQEDVAKKIKEDSKGRYVVAGTTGDGFYTDVLLSRLDHSGNLDKSFNQTGYLVLNFGPKDRSYAADFLIINNNKILLLVNHYAETSTSYNINCFLINENGTIDSTYGVNGKLMIDINNQTDVACSIIQADGAFWIGGYTTKSNRDQIIIAKLDSLGHLDANFGNKGISINAIGSSSMTPTSMKITSDKSFRLSGRISTSGYPDACIVGISSKGTIDSSFAVNGVFQFNRSNRTDHFNSFFIYPTGQIIAAGFSEDSIDDKTIILKLKNKISVGIIDQYKTISLTKFFPNPFQHNATIEMNLNESLEFGIRLFDESGKYISELVPNKSYNAGLIEVPIEVPNQLRSGNYILVIQSKNKILASIKTKFLNQ